MFRQGAKYSEIEKGARICKVIKNYYFESIPWGDCHKQVSELFTAIKALAKKQYPDLDKTEILAMFANFDKQDFEDLLHDSKTHGCEPERDSESIA